MASRYSDALVLEKRSFALVKRSRSKCAPSIGTFLSKRSYDHLMSIDERKHAADFEKRMLLPAISMGYFYSRSFPDMKPIVPDTPDNVGDMSTSVIQAFSDLQANEEFSTGTAGLKGCTTLYIISRTGVFASHYWESISFSPDAEVSCWEIGHFPILGSPKIVFGQVSNGFLPRQFPKTSSLANY